MQYVTIYYFSGTGNTAYVAKLFAEQFHAHDTQCQIVPMEDILLKRKDITLDNTDLVGIGFPVHAMDAPEIVYNLLQHLPIGNYKYFIFKTAGDPTLNGGSNFSIRQHLGTKGWKAVHQSLTVMPSNMGVTPRPEVVKHLALLAQKQVKRTVDEILEGTIVTEPESSLRPLFKAFGKFESMGAKRYSSKWRVSDACIHCGKCVKECPTKNIKAEGTKLIFGQTCIWCFRCAFHCPTQAIMLPKFMDKIRIAPYDIEQIVNDPGVRSDYFLRDTSARHLSFRKHFQKLGLLEQTD